MSLIGPLVQDGKKAQAPLLRYKGQYVVLERLQSKHAESLYNNIHLDESLWTYMPRDADDFKTLQGFQDYIDSVSKLHDPFFYAIKKIDNEKDVVGHIALMNFNIPNRVNEIGHVLLSKKLQRSTAATETFYLLIKASFEQLNSRRCEWKTNTLNEASRKAALRLGFTFEGIFRNHMIVKGHSRDSIYFSIIESEWSTRKKIFETWLDPSNFDAQSNQIKGLNQIATDLGQQPPS